MSVHISDSEWRYETSGGIPYKLMEGYPKGSVESENGEATEQYIINADDLSAFLLESFPPMLVWPGGLWAYPPTRRCPSFIGLSTKKIDFESFVTSKPCDPSGIDSDATNETYSQFMLLKISYEPSRLDEDDEGDDTLTFLEIDSDTAGKYLMVPPHGDAATFKAAQAVAHRSPDPEHGDPGQERVDVGDDVGVSSVDVPVTKTIPQIEWSVRFPRVNRLALPTIIKKLRACLGKVNLTVIPALFDAEVETCLCMGYSIREEFQWGGDGSLPVSIDIKFIEQRITEEGDDFVKGHNYVYNPNKGIFEKIKFNGRFLYETANMNSIWTQLDSDDFDSG